jgi:hypothetical protein
MATHSELILLQPPSDLGKRAALGATYYLAAFAILYVVGQGLPCALHIRRSVISSSWACTRLMLGRACRKTDFLTKIDRVVLLALGSMAVNMACTMFLYKYTEPPQLQLQSLEDLILVDLNDLDTEQTCGADCIEDMRVRAAKALAINRMVLIVNAVTFIIGNIKIFKTT